jgi:hypothetical protein
MAASGSAAVDVDELAAALDDGGVATGVKGCAGCETVGRGPRAWAAAGSVAVGSVRALTAEAATSIPTTPLNTVNPT